MTVLTRPLDAVSAILSRGRADPAWFAEAILRAPLWPMQAEILRALIGEPRARVAVKACHASGKTYMAARAVLAFFYLYPQCRILTTAPTWTGVRKLLWSEVATAFHALPANMGGELLETELRAGRDWWAMGLSTNQGVRFQGHHAEHMLIVLDEAPGVHPEIWEAVEGIRAGGDVRVLAIGNPTAVGGAFYEAFTTARATWHTFTISAFDTPNLAGLTPETLLTLSEAELDVTPRPYLTTRRWVREKHRDWGPDSPLWHARVLGEFPKSDDSAVIPLAWVEAANTRWQEWRDSEQEPPAFTCVGVDIGGGGDKTVLALRHGPLVPELHRLNIRDSMAIAGHIALILGTRGGYAYVDEIGIGAGIGARLREQSLPCEAFIAGAASPFTDASGELGFANRRAEAWWNLRTLLDPQYGNPIALPPDDLLIGDLTAPRWKPTSGGKILVESKDEIRKRLGRSTDDGDAVVQAFAARLPDTTPRVVVDTTSVQISPY